MKLPMSLMRCARGFRRWANPSEDICYATTNRQRALQSMVGECDVVLVIGSCNSSNSRRLVELAQRSGTPAYLIDGPDDIEPEWLSSVSTIGVTAEPPRRHDWWGR